MSSQSELDLSCPICHDIFEDPVILLCSHSFCKDCLQRWWSEKQMNTCPVCNKTSLVTDPPSNLVLKNLCETFLQERNPKASPGSEPVCSVHFEKLKLFCMDHQQPVCVVCRDSKSHMNHRFRPVDEAAQNHRGELQKCLKLLKDKLKTFEEVKGNFNQTVQHIKTQTQHTKNQIKEQFGKLHQFLQEEEEARITALSEEEQQKNKVIWEKIDALNRQITDISDTIRAAEEEIGAADVSFLQRYSVSIKTVQERLPLNHPGPVDGALVDVAKHVGNLNFNIWSKMKELVSYSPLILDPNTAHPELTLSEDLTSVSMGQRQKLPDNPERFDEHFCILSAEGFASGTHCWDVDVTNDRCWGLGVMTESAKRKGQIQTGFWQIYFLDGKLTAISPPLPNKDLPVEKLQKVRVQLDWDRGKLSFYDIDTKKHIYTIRHVFTEKLFPYIGNTNERPLKIIPMTISVFKENKVSLSSGYWPFYS